MVEESLGASANVNVSFGTDANVVVEVNRDDQLSNVDESKLLFRVSRSIRWNLETREIVGVQGEEVREEFDALSLEGFECIVVAASLPGSTSRNSLST